MPVPAARTYSGRSVVNATAARELPVLTLVIGLMLVVYAAVDAAVNPASERAWRLAVSLVPSAVLLAVYGVSRSRYMRAAHAPWLTLLGLVVVTIGQAATIYLGRDVSDLSLLLVLWCVSGAAALGTVQFVTIGAVLIPVWAVCARLVVAGDGWALAGDWSGAVLATIVCAGTVHLGRAASFREQERMQDDLAQLACADALTGVASRYGASAGFGSLRAEASRRRALLFAVFVDVDGLKRTNDLFGHDAGDALIIAAGRAIAASTRRTDLVARWGGDEFVVMGAGDPPDIQTLKGAIELHLNHAVHERALPRTVVSLGLAVCPPDTADIATLVNQADADMYARRHERRGQLRVVRDVDRESASA